MSEILEYTLNKVFYSLKLCTYNYYCEEICGLRGSNGVLKALNDS
jgi:hypothetical protein